MAISSISSIIQQRKKDALKDFFKHSLQSDILRVLSGLLGAITAQSSKQRLQYVKSFFTRAERKFLAARVDGIRTRFVQHMKDIPPESTLQGVTQFMKTTPRILRRKFAKIVDSKCSEIRELKKTLIQLSEPKLQQPRAQIVTGTQSSRSRGQQQQPTQQTPPPKSMVTLNDILGIFNDDEDVQDENNPDFAKGVLMARSVTKPRPANSKQFHSDGPQNLFVRPVIQQSRLAPRLHPDGFQDAFVRPGLGHASRTHSSDPQNFFVRSRSTRVRQQQQEPQTTRSSRTGRATQDRVQGQWRNRMINNDMLYKMFNVPNNDFKRLLFTIDQIHPSQMREQSLLLDIFFEFYKGPPKLTTPLLEKKEALRDILDRMSDEDKATYGTLRDIVINMMKDMYFNRSLVKAITYDRIIEDMKKNIRFKNFQYMIPTIASIHTRFYRPS